MQWNRGGMLRIPIQHRPAALTFADDDLQLEVLIDHLGEVLPPKWSTQTHTLLGSFYDQRRAFKATVSRRRKSTMKKKSGQAWRIFLAFFLAILLPVDAADKIATPPDSKARGLLHLVLRKIPQPTPHESRGRSEKRENAARGEKDFLHIII